MLKTPQLTGLTVLLDMFIVVGFPGLRDDHQVGRVSRFNKAFWGILGTETSSISFSVPTMYICRYRDLFARWAGEMKRNLAIAACVVMAVILIAVYILYVGQLQQGNSVPVTNPSTGALMVGDYLKYGGDGTNLTVVAVNGSGYDSSCTWNNGYQDQSYTAQQIGPISSLDFLVLIY
jgi:hypothetical protein